MSNNAGQFDRKSRKLFHWGPPPPDPENPDYTVENLRHRVVEATPLKQPFPGGVVRGLVPPPLDEFVAIGSRIVAPTWAQFWQPFAGKVHRASASNPPHCAPQLAVTAVVTHTMRYATADHLMRYATAGNEDKEC